MSAPTSKKILSPAEVPSGGHSRRQGSVLRFFGWILLPTLVAVALGVWMMDWSAPAAGRPVAAPSQAQSTPALSRPAPTKSPVPTASIASLGAAVSPTAAPVTQAAASPTAAPAAQAATNTPDDQTLALLTELPATLPASATATAVLALPTATQAPIPTDAPDVVETPPPNAPPLAFLTLPPTSAPATVAPAPAPVAEGSVDPLTGLPADAAAIARVPIVVMIDNHPDAAPQTGLNNASMVIEALAEGGITRFETFFLTGDAPTLGPVRSARPYFVEWAYPFKPLYTHCGGSWEAIDLIREAAGILTDVDCFNGNMPFWRSDSRLMPHNLYTSTTQMWKMAARHGLAAPANEPRFLHSPALPPDQRPTSGSLSFVFSGLSRSDIMWVYDHDTNRYLRKQWGAWHRDLQTNEIISASNVVVLWTNVWELPGDEKGRMGTDTVGQGVALIMRDGQNEWGYWDRKNPYAALNIYDGKRQTMRFAPGRIWIEALAVGKGVHIGH